MKTKFDDFTKKYLIDKRVRLISMKGEDSLKSGDEGTIEHIDDIGQIHVKWDNGSSLALIPEEDEYEVITEANF